MTGKLLGGASALVLGLAMSSAAMAGGPPSNNGSANDNVATDGGDITLRNNDTRRSGNTDDSTTIVLGNVDAAISIERLQQSNTGQVFEAKVVDGEDTVLNMDASVGDNAARNAAGVVQTHAQTGFQPQLQQGSSIGAVGTVNIAGGANGS